MAYDLEGQTGYDGGPGGRAAISLHHFAQGLPFALRLGVGYSGRPPGDALLARHVFINDNSNGTPESNGRRWVFALDAVFVRSRGLLAGSTLFAGPRVSRFAARFDFLDGNEDFTVTTTQWGLGGGIEHAYAIDPRDEFVWCAGADYYLSAPLTGHGTTYSPDGSSVDPKDNYTWADADQAVNQPKFTPRFSIGLRRTLGR